MCAQTTDRTDAPLAMRTALEERDLQGVMDALAPDVLLRSPITNGFHFTGREQMRALYEAVFDGLRDFRVTGEIRGSQSERVLLIEGHIGSQPFEEVQVLRLDELGRVREMTLFFRPLPALPALAQMLAGTLIAPRSRPRALVLKALVGPLVAATRVGDRIVVRLVGAIAGMTTPSRAV